MIYLDNAATSWPKPESVYQVMGEFLRTKGGNPGRGSHTLATAAAEAIKETRIFIARLINAPRREQVIFTLNCTDALNMGLKGLLKPGDHVITSCIEHNSVVRPLTKLARRGVKITKIPPSKETGVVSAHDIEEAITKDTKLVVITHASNVTGIIQPIEVYGELVRKRGLIFMVDAAQTAGTYPIDVQAANIDLLACSGHKGLFGPPGTGVLYIGDRVDLDPLREGGTGTHSEMEEQPDTLPERYESGTLNSVGISGLGAGLKYIFAEGLERIRTHEQYLTERLIQGLLNIPGVALYTAKDLTKQASIVSLTIEGYEPGEVGVILDQTFDIKARTGLHCAPAAHRTLGTFPLGTIRLSPGYFNTVEEIDATLQDLDRIARTVAPKVADARKG
ncbi:MAG: cysteine desulfurase [Deltaproteobacteria bacterium RBG_13_52_11]|nr:MAG: cysteine desulfurase [Deltaproteobacteria bacterium RBG_13_52_11]